MNKIVLCASCFVLGAGVASAASAFIKDFPTALYGKYLAVLTYVDDGVSWFRVFQNTADSDGTLTIDLASGAGSAGYWTQAAVPEPTSGILLLFGLAGLALRRR